MSITRFIKCITPGIRVKRWLSLIFLGLFLIVCGFIIFIRFDFSFFLDNIALRIPQIIPVINGYEVILDFALIFTGFTIVYIGVRKLFLSIFSVFAPNEDKKELIDRIYKSRQLDRGIKVAVIGGGTGLSTFLRGLKNYVTNITAIVTVADDGGSSGRLRKDMGAIPPGDIRNCLVALSASESLMASLFQYRFTSKDLQGHSFGNLFLVALSEVVGDFDKAIKESSKVLAITGKVLPATLEPVVLMANMEDGTVIEGETNITRAKGRIKEIFLKPSSPKPLDEVVDSLKEADVIVLGPGSLYTSVIPNLLVPEIAYTIKQSRAVKIYICNVMTQPGETDGFSASDHVKSIFEHTDKGLFDYVIVNNKTPEQLLEKYKEQGAYPVEIDRQKLLSFGIKLIVDNLINDTDYVRHDPDKLARLVMDIAMHKREK